MNIQISTKHILIILYILTWIIFVGISIVAGGFIVGAFFALVKPEIVKNLWLWQEVDLSALYGYGHSYFFVVTIITSIVAVMKAVLFYLIIDILHGNKKLDIAQPFSKPLGRLIFNLSYLSLLIGVFSAWGVKYSEWLVKKGVKMPGVEHLHIGGADVWLFMGIILFIIAQIFKRGIEIQADNELTV